LHKTPAAKLAAGVFVAALTKYPLAIISARIAFALIGSALKFRGEDTPVVNVSAHP